MVQSFMKITRMLYDWLDNKLTMKFKSGWMATWNYISGSKIF